MNERVKEKKMDGYIYIFVKNDKVRDNKAIYVGY